MKKSALPRSSSLFARPSLAGLLTGAALLALPGVSTAQLVDNVPTPGLTMPDALHGAEAIDALGDKLTDVAQAYDMSADELTALLRDDPTLWITGDDKLLYVDIPAAERFVNEPASFSGGGIPLEDAFFLHTNPGANKVIFLDFDGHQSKNNGWGHNITFPAFNTSGSASSFSNGELQSIIAHWEYIKEDFAAYDVDVTTEEPDIDYLRKSTVGDNKWGIRCLFTQITQGFGSGSGGVALLGTFTDFQDTPCFAFNKGDNTGSMTGSHEVGHTLSLQHDGLNGSSYHPGTGSGATSWGPIMGAPFGETVVQWSNGDYAGSTSTQDDIGFIGGFANGINVKPDDHGDVVGLGTALPIACPGTSFATVSGVIHTRTDLDVFEFSTAGGSVSISATPWNPGPNLDILLELYDAGGSLIASHSPNNATNASISQNLSAGSYSVLIDGVGKPGVYSDYGSQGQYDLTVNATPLSAFADLGGALAGSTGLPSASGTGFPCVGNLVTIDLAGALPSTNAWLALGIGQLNAPFKGGVLIPNITLGGAFLPTPTSASGTVSLPSTWPAGVVPGVPIDFQFWIQDAGGISGFASSNGLELITP
jgi:hypothetical protein